VAILSCKQLKKRKVDVGSSMGFLLETCFVDLLLGRNSIIWYYEIENRKKKYYVQLTVITKKFISPNYCT
jgi:hypothetical protein